MSVVRKITSGMERRYWTYTFLSPLFMFGEVIMETTIPLVMAKIVDVGIKNKDSDFVIRFGLLMVLMASFSLFCGAMCGRISSLAAFGFSKNLRKKLFARVQDFSFSNMDHFGTDSLVTRLTTDVTNLQNMYQNCIRTAVRSPIMLIFGTIMACQINARLALIFFIVIPLLATVLISIVHIVYPRFRQMLKKYDNLNRVVQENLIAIRVVKAFVRGDHENAKFDEIAEDLQRTQVGAEKIVILNMPIMHLMVYGCIVSALWFGGNMVISGKMQTGGLISFISYITQILMSLMMLSRLFVMFILSRTSLSRVMEVLDEEIEIHNAECKMQNEERCLSPLQSGRQVLEARGKSLNDIEFSHVYFSYDKKMEHSVLSDINLSIPQGSTVGILGGTGSSKSTLVQLIPRLYEVTEGSVKVGGKDVRQWNLTDLRKKIGFVLQKNTLFSGTIAENLRWGNENASDEDLIAACKASDAHGFVTSFPDGYDTDLSQGGVNLSGGQKQRLCIARALIKKPDILVLDDSTSAVDTATDLRIRNALRSSLPATTKLIIAQRIASVQDADFIIVLDSGKINGIGSHDELMKSNQIYREVYESQMSEN
ncbi:ABC transporter ATP-binding protein [Treponema sp. UBA3813]|uniref:ABC transporter ATP-binding protein n=1 Tax=Treponema sp. UBA3813 TaxID=1947715 RepID=UPI0025ED8607|nr:ABC transporter ATP-binding protein [Treponema sp. UBA3813]